jgi:ureidoacrylate peracid hydrolase
MASAEGPSVGAPDGFSAKQSGTHQAEVAPARTALLVVDLVNEYVEPSGLMPMPGCVAGGGALIDANRRLADGARAAGAKIVWIRPGHQDSSDGLFRKRIVHALEGTWGSELHPGLGVEPGERILSKRRYSAFFATDLDVWLREHQIERVVVTGVALNICVRATVHDAFFNGYDVWLVQDAAQATSEREAASTLYDIATHYGDVTTVTEVLKAWS